MQDPQQRDDLIRQLGALERQVVSLRTQLLPEPEPPASEAFTAVGVVIGASLYALQTTMIEKIIPLVSWQPLPESPRWVLGVFRYRGQTLPLIDLHKRLSEGEIPLTASMVILVTKGPRAVGLVASGVTKLIHVAASDITPPPTDVTYASFITGSLSSEKGKVMHILSAPRLRREFVLGPEARTAATQANEGPSS